MIKAIIILVSIAAAILLANVFVYPIKRGELVVLDKIYQKGSGFDDAVQELLIKHQGRYAPEIINILNLQKYGSYHERVALNFVELVVGEPGVKNTLKKLQINHPNKDVVELINAILSGPVEETVVYESSEVKVSRVE